MAERTLSTVNRAGSAEDNPLLDQVTIRLKLHKHGASEELKKCWVQTGKKVFADLTALATSTDSEVTIDITAGIHLKAGFPAVKNVVHFTTSDHRHVKNTLWVASQPPVMITLDGYNANDPAKPLIYPYYNSG